MTDGGAVVQASAMLYVVGGCSRSGKSTLAERMRVRHGVPWFPLDALMMGLHKGAPTLGVHPYGNDLETGDRMWPITKGVLEHLDFDGRDYLVEGVNLRPRTVAAFMQEAQTPVRACFLGYAEIAIEDKAALVAQYAGLPNDWLGQRDLDYVRRYLAESRDLSRDLRSECGRLGFPYIDTGSNLEAGLIAAETALTSPDAWRS